MFPLKDDNLSRTTPAVTVGLIIVNVLRGSFRWESFAALLAVGLLKSGPLLLFLILLVRHRAAVWATYALPAWAAAAVPVSALGAVPAGARTR